MELVPPRDTIQAYWYMPLPTTTHIRRCIIQPDTPDKPILIAIDTVAFEVAIAPLYEALSYVWGSKEDPLQVMVDCGSRIFRSISVTQNLYGALRQLRCTHSARFMWIDAIFINQDDDLEKGPHVEMMARIYQRATRVVAWLGPNADGMEIAMKLMGSLGSQVVYNYTRGELEVVSDSVARDLTDLSKSLFLKNDEIRPLAALLRRPWFTRLWIRQEIFLGNEDSIVCFGDFQVSWPEFRNALRLLAQKEIHAVPAMDRSSPKWKELYLSELYQALISVSGFSVQDRSVRPEYMRRYFDVADCVDKRDRVFAVLGFLGKTLHDGLGIKPDYTQTFEVIYTNIVKGCIERWRALDIIGQCELSDGPPANSLPSWVPDWSRKSTNQVYNTEALASSHISPLYTVIQGHSKLLRVTGVITTSIQKTGPAITPMQTYTLGEAVWMLHTAISTLNTGAKKNYSQDADIVNMYAQTMLCGDEPKRFHPYRNLAYSTQDPAGVIRRLFSGTLSATIDDLGLSGVVNMYSSFLIGRRLGWDARGTLIVCPGTAEPGDLVSILVGCRFPMMLRPLVGNGQDGDSHTVVGQCFTADTCDGESMLGPLPQGTRIAKVRAANSQYGFVNDSTGEVSFLDPRLAVEGLGFDVEEEKRRTQGCPGLRVDVTYDGLKDLIKKRTGRELRWLDLI
ncbi:HET-domain-containing protein [Apiospora marii]|uniref:HET-domain-containing protein n=1 Tax=Apiospora marii TaxID=335849 RepID=UPI00312D9314